MNHIVFKNITNIIDGYFIVMAGTCGMVGTMCLATYSADVLSGNWKVAWSCYHGLLLTTSSWMHTLPCVLIWQRRFWIHLWIHLCQDPIEEYFGSQQKIGRRSDNPDIKMFGYNDNTIHIQRSVSCQSGNTRGRKDRKKAWVEVTDEPLPKRKKKDCNRN